MSRWHLLARLVRRRLLPAVSIVLIAAAFSTAFTGVIAVRASAANAVADGVRFSQSNHAFAVQAVGPSAASAFAGRDDLFPVWNSNGSVATAARQVPVAIRAIDDVRAAPGALLSGAHPSGAGQATVSAEVAETLGVKLGATVTVDDGREPREYTVSGITVNPADRGELGVSTFAPGDAEDTTLWLLDSDPFVDAQLGPILEARQAKGRTVEFLAAEDEASAMQTLLSALSLTGPALAVLGTCLCGVLLAALRRERRRDVEALAAAGMPKRAGWRLMAQAAFGCLAVGTVAGIAAGWALTYLLRDPLSEQLGQYWRSAVLPWPGAVTYALLVPVGMLAAAVAVVKGRKLGTVLQVKSSRARVWVPVGVGGLALWGLLLVPSFDISNSGRLGLALLGGLAVVGSISMLLPAITSWRTGPAMRRLVAVSTRPLAGLAVSGALLVFCISYYTASQTHSSNRSSAQAIAYQPAGSLLIQGLNETTRRTIEDRYNQLGGRQTVHYLLAVETQHTVRVTNPRLIACFDSRFPKGTGTVHDASLMSDCEAKGTNAPINVVALTEDPGIGEQVRADPALVEGGEVGIFDFTVGEGTALSTAVVQAVPLPLLGGNVPAAVVGVDSSLARRYALTPSGEQFLALLDFGSLTEQDKASMRRSISQIASTAQAREDRGFHDGGRQAIATAVGLGGAGLLVMLLAAVGGAFLASQQQLRRLLGQIGVGKRRRRALGVRMLAVPTVALAVAVGAALLSVWLAGARGQAGFGWAFAVPAAAGVLTCVYLMHAYGRIRQSSMID